MKLKFTSYLWQEPFIKFFHGKENILNIKYKKTPPELLRNHYPIYVVEEVIGYPNITWAAFDYREKELEIKCQIP